MCDRDSFLSRLFLSILQIWAGLSAGSWVTNMFAKDLDAGENGTVTFSLVKGELLTLCTFTVSLLLMSSWASPFSVSLSWFRGWGFWTLWDWQWNWRHQNNRDFHPEHGAVLHSESHCQGRWSHTSGGHCSRSCSGTDFPITAGYTLYILIMILTQFQRRVLK